MSTPAQVVQPVTSTTHCFHCNEPLLGSTLTVRVDERNEPVCCQGCRAVAELIAATGLGDYYRFREVAGARPDSGAPRPDQWAALNRPEVAAQFVRHSRDDYAVLAVDGLRCSACSWLIDRVVKSLPGVQESTTNSATGRTFVSWRGAETLLGDICRKIAELGYRPHPLTADGPIDLQQDERRDALKRLAVAGFGMMQVMMFAVATYSADLAGEVLDPALFDFFRIVSLLVATPVLFYAAAPVFTAACRNFRTRTIGMDVPVAIALGLAYSASLWNTLRHTEAQVYFDSVTMFIFFLTLARFVQMSVRRRTIETTEALSRQLPSYAHRIERDTLSDVPLAALQPGDIVLVRPGEVLPADGELLDTEACIDEAMLSGESLPMSRRTGDRLSAGMLNAGNPLRLRVLAVAAGTALSHIASLQQRAQAQRPAMAKAADAAAARFLNYVLLGAGLTCAFWLSVNPSRAFETTLSVLVVACPCAFAIATPAAISAVAAHLARLGVLVTRIDAIEALARIDQVVFDKTGTLTHGDITVQRCIPLADLDETECLRIAAALELASEHPLARAFAGFGVRGQAIRVRAVPGAGLEGSVDGHRYRIGTRPFVMQLRGEPSEAAKDADVTGTAVVLGDEQRELALFELHDTPRSSAATSIGVLRAMGIRTQIVSGDSRPAVASLAMQCGVSEYLSRYSPEQKLAHVQTLQARGRRVAMVGDGVNDAPVLAASDLSIAMGRGAALAHASADMLLMTENLDSLPRAIELARKAQRIARQNLFWSAVYNFGSLPLAAAGLVSPWIAALGMSLSSIAVVLNSARLLPARSRTELPASAPGNLS